MDKLRVFVFCFVLMFLTSLVYSLTPSAGSVTEQSSVRAPAGSPDSDGAFAGNVTEIDFTGYSLTQSWQGYFGNVTGTIQLADGDNNVMYNWSVAEPEGEIYATVLGSVSWSKIQCFNFTATGTESGEASADIGNTSQHGMNLNQLESNYSIASDDVDGVDETFGFNKNGNSHTAFYTNNLHFTSGECLSAHMFGSEGHVDDNYFEEVILYDSDNHQPIFTALLDNSQVGFDDRLHDFEMLVLDDGHGTDTAVTTYYFYVEIE